MSFETTKAQSRRSLETISGGFNWSPIFVGNGVDVGCGPDKLPFDSCMGFDLTEGDANHLDQYFQPGSLNYIHASHVLEHLQNPEAALRTWLTLIRTGGYICFTVPDVGAYERFEYPSKYNPDHRASFSMIYLGSVFPIHIHIPTLCTKLSDAADTLIARYVEVNFDWKLGRHVDQTWKVEDGCEIWNEVLLRRK